MICELEIAGGKRRCPACQRPVTLDRQGRVPVRKCEGSPLTWNDLESATCPHLGPVLRTAGCQLCGQKDKQVPIHACQHPEKLGHEVTQDRYKAGQFRTDVCRTCKLFPVATAARGILDHHEPIGPVEEADEEPRDGRG